MIASLKPCILRIAVELIYSSACLKITTISAVNVTFGTEDMKVTGIKEDGTEVLLMKDGDFQF